MKGIIGLRRKLQSKRECITSSYQSLEGARVRDKISISERVPDWQQEWKDLRMHLRTTKGVQSKNEKQEEFAWHRAHKLRKELFKTNEHCKDETSSEVMSSTKAKKTRQHRRHIPKKGWSKQSLDP